MEPSLGRQTPVSSNLGSQLLSANKQSSAQMESSLNVRAALPFNLGLEQLSSTNRQSILVEPSPKIHTAVPINLWSQNIVSTNKQSRPEESSPKVHASIFGNLGHYQSLTTGKQSVQMECSSKVRTAMSSNLGSQQSSSTKKRTIQMELLPKVQTAMFINSGTQQLLSTNKRTAQMEQSPKVQSAMSINLGLQKLSSTNKLITTTEPSPKVQTESFESVRSKLRESLAASLALVSDEQSKSQTTGKSSPSESANTSRQEDASTESGELTCHLSGGSSETLTSNEHDAVKKCDEGQNLSNEITTNENTSEYMQTWKCGVQEFQLKHGSLEDDVSFSNNFIMKDELLQENGLCWVSDLDCESTEAKDGHDSKRPKLAHEEITGDLSAPACQSPQTLAAKIEVELFTLFGGVNKKYKEKGRSLLFNLKDPKNPELRERVVSGEISPERLCSMTAEELASKELSEWRIAKAEEFAQMVVLPDSEVDFRRLVRKTHKGEFQVEVERDDSVSVEVSLGANSLSEIPRKASETEAQTQPKSPSKLNEIGASEGSVLTEKLDSGSQNPLNNLTYRPHEKTDLMQDFMVDELKDAEFLPPIVSLDEFMEALDSEPPFENLTVDTVQNIPTPNEKNSDCSESKVDNAPDSSESRLHHAPDTLESTLDPASDRLRSKMDPAPDGLGSKLDHASQSPGSKLDHAVAGSTDPVDSAADDPDKVDVKSMRTGGNMKPVVHMELDSCPPDVASKGEHVWEGLIQLNISSLVTVLGFYRSGEKTSTREWPSFLEIKGRVRLDAFEKFLQELPLSRSRAIMVVQFRWKEGSPDSGRINLCETIESYIADERVGFVEPCPGVEMYLCPPHIKTTQMLGEHLTKEHSETLVSTDNGLMGIVVWRKAHESSPRLSAHHKHGSSKKHFISRKQQNSNVNTTSKPSVPPFHTGAPPINSDPTSEHEPTDDVPPGFGPPSARDEDDLPEFDFVQGSIDPSRAQGRPPARAVEQMRELIQKYGQSKTGKNLTVNIHQSWNDEDDDDIPEWQPHQDNQPKPPPPPPQLHGFQQPRLINQHSVHVLPHQPSPPPPPPRPHAPPQHQYVIPMATPLPMPFQPWMGPTQVPQTLPPPGKQPGMWWPTRGPIDVGLPSNVSMQPCHLGGPPVEGQFYGMKTFGNSQNGMDWRPDFPS